MKYSNDFEMALKFTLKWEGFISEDLNDPGGLTIYGITYRWHKEAVMEMKRLIECDQKEDALEIAKEIYYKNYWLKAGCDRLPYPFSIIVFDTAVNMGVSRALETYVKCKDWRDYLFARIEFYAESYLANNFLRGWTNRCLDLWKEVRKERR